MRLTVIIMHCFFYTSAFCQIKSQLEDLPKYPLKKIVSYCQSDSLIPVSRTHFSYDEAKRLVRSIFYYDTAYQYVKEFEYDAKGLLSKIYSYELSTESRSRENMLLLTYNKSGQLITEEYENAPGTPKQQNEYNNKGLLYIRTTTADNWSQQDIYDYDANGLLIKADLGNGGIVTYNYSNNKLIKETNHYKNRTGVEILYQYDDYGLLLLKNENGKTIQRNQYQNGHLIKQRSNYYGIDPCIVRPCCLQTISYFEYYE